MTRLSIARIRRDLADAVNRVAYGGERIVLHRRGRAVAALVSVEDAQALEALEDRLDLEAGSAALREGGEAVPHEKVKKDLGLA